MKYLIKIEEVVEPTETVKYPSNIEIYKQIVFGLNVEWLVSIINNRHQEDN